MNRQVSLSISKIHSSINQQDHYYCLTEAEGTGIAENEKLYPDKQPVKIKLKKPGNLFRLPGFFESSTDGFRSCKIFPDQIVDFFPEIQNRFFSAGIFCHRHFLFR